MFSGEVIGLSAALCMSVVRRFFFFPLDKCDCAAIEVPYGGYNKLMCSSKRLIMIWYHDA